MNLDAIQLQPQQGQIPPLEFGQSALDKSLLHIFNEYYGALADCEKSLLVSGLRERMPAEISFVRNDEYPVYEIHEAFYINGQLPFFERMKAKYNCYRGEPFRPLLAPKNYYEEVAREFAGKDLDTKHPLQDFRDRGRRLQVMGSSVEAYNLALKKGQERYTQFLKTLNVFERVAFFVVSFFHSIISSPIEFTKLPELSISTTFASFNDKAVKLAETEIDYEGK